MPTPIRPSCRSAAKALLGALRPAALAAALLAPAPVALANDRDLRGTPVPAAACIEIDRFGFTGPPWFLGYFRLGAAGGILVLRCPLPVNNVELSGAGNDNDLSKFRVHYGDGDGFGAGTYVQVTLKKTFVSAGTSQTTSVCTFDSNVAGTGAATAVTATKACAHDVTGGEFYFFVVVLHSAGAFAEFRGVDFPT
jgi:hypothetical protein